MWSRWAENLIETASDREVPRRAKPGGICASGPHQPGARLTSRRKRCVRKVGGAGSRSHAYMYITPQTPIDSPTVIAAPVPLVLKRLPDCAPAPKTNLLMSMRAARPPSAYARKIRVCRGVPRVS